MEYKINYIEFKSNLASEVSTDAGIYQIVALPFSEKETVNNITMLKGYVDYCQNFFLHSWEGKVKTKASFKNRKISIELEEINPEHIKRSTDYIDTKSKEDLGDFFLQFLPFLPSLYIGIADNLKKRFQDHTRMSDQNSIIYKITNDTEYEIFSKAKVYFIWKPIIAPDLPDDIKLREDILEDFERVMIQTKKPLINKVKQK
jgi:hypothetical protein